MAIVITNGQCYLTFSKTGAIKKTQNIDEARNFYNVNTASMKLQNKMTKAPVKCKGYYVFDTDGDEHELSTPKKVKKRKQYSALERKVIYDKFNGRCALCGKRITLTKMTLDHIVPLGMGGIDDISNLQACCYPDNQFKGSILPDDFMERISRIFMYQMETKHNNGWRWKILRKMLIKLEMGQ